MLAFLFNQSRDEFEGHLHTVPEKKAKTRRKKGEQPPEEPPKKAKKTSKTASVYLSVLCKFQDDLLTQFWDVHSSKDKDEDEDEDEDDEDNEENKKKKEEKRKKLDAVDLAAASGNTPPLILNWLLTFMKDILLSYGALLFEQSTLLLQQLAKATEKVAKKKTAGLHSFARVEKLLRKKSFLGSLLPSFLVAFHHWVHGDWLQIPTLIAPFGEFLKEIDRLGVRFPEMKKADKMPEDVTPPLKKTARVIAESQHPYVG